MQRFRDRTEAGMHLAAAIDAKLGDGPPAVVLGVPRGGVVVADVVAERLGCDLDVLGVEKVGAPWNPELAVGAVGEGDALWIDEDLASRVPPDLLKRTIEQERAELERKLSSVRAVWPRVDLAGRTAIIVDDGVATGSTVRAALMALERADPTRRVLAVPVGPPKTLTELERIADVVICPLRPLLFQSVGMWYDAFDQVSQAEVLAIFERRLNQPEPSVQ